MHNIHYILLLIYRDLNCRYFVHFYWIGTTFTLFTLTMFVPAYQRQHTFVFTPLIIPMKKVFGYLDSPNYYTIRNSSVFLALFMLSLQTLRRLYECIFISKFSQAAKMHLGHYLLGIFFYILVNITIISDGVFLNSGLQMISKFYISSVKIYVQLVCISTGF